MGRLAFGARNLGRAAPIDLCIAHAAYVGTHGCVGVQEGANWFRRTIFGSVS